MSETWSASPESREGLFVPRRRNSTTTRPPAAIPPAAIAAAGRTQLRGSRRERSSDSESSSAHAESSSAAASVTALSVSSSRPESFSGGSIGRSAERSRLSTSVVGSAAIDLHPLLELLDRAVNQDLGRPVGATERARDLTVVHAEREAHDQRVAAVIGQVLEVLHDALQLLPALDDLLGPVQRRDRLRLLEDPLRAPGPVAVVVRCEVVRDPDEPGPERPPIRLSASALEVPVGLEECLLGDVLGVVVVADPVVGVRIDVAQVVAVEALEGAVELSLRLRAGSRAVLRVGHTASVLVGLMPHGLPPWGRAAAAPPASRAPSIRRVRSHPRSVRRGPRGTSRPCRISAPPPRSAVPNRGLRTPGRSRRESAPPGCPARAAPPLGGCGCPRRGSWR